jgi:hypothetical protein
MLTSAPQSFNVQIVGDVREMVVRRRRLSQARVREQGFSEQNRRLTGSCRLVTPRKAGRCHAAAAEEQLFKPRCDQQDMFGIYFAGEECSQNCRMRLDCRKRAGKEFQLGASAGGTSEKKRADE